MTRVLIGMLAGAGLLAAVALVWMRGADGCLGRCGATTHCADHQCIATVEPKPAAAPPKEHRRRHHDSSAAAAPELQLHPGDEKMVAQGDALGRPEHLDLTQPDGHELTQDEIDREFNPSNPRIIQCITDAIGNYPLESGKVLVGLRIEKDGHASRIRVEAPALLQRQGVSRCIRGVVAAMRFPASGGAQVVTYDFGVQ